jgi:hypothetical protein
MKTKPISILIFSIAFIIFTIIGTLSHEYGHVIVAKYLGHNTELHYGSMNFNSAEEKKLTEIYIRNKSSIQNKKPYPEKEIFGRLVKKTNSDSILITIGGPFQTILTGTIGFFLLLFRRKKIFQNGMKILDWLYVFLSLFWLREVFNIVMSVSNALINNKKNYFGGDEKNIAMMLEIPKGSIAIPLGIIGLLVSLLVVFKVIPLENRLSFLLSGFFGGIIGFILWLRILGPIVMP